jgi:transcriptional regulator with XRE-family HTH domain
MKKNATKARAAQPVDKYVGTRIEAARHAAGMSQMLLGDALGISFQQVQKYEKGTNRVSCGTIALIATALQVPVGYFFDGAPGVGKSNGTVNKMSEFFSVEGAAKMADAYVSLAPEHRTAVRMLASSL